ncbi:hexose kinase [Shimia thalassica]|uniref:1-phosphofructokinase family hexose kinase n=1 Tax=Shimia thalassica TaxID=1715693 RepID=UPI002732FD94|nr:hexose kinase [Shimia thalassica]MDP2582155.1 hexose kinase [Shimia thalassica]
MRDILTITLNPAVDLSTAVDVVTAGPKLRCARPCTDPGGGGINVSRAIRELGGDSRTFVALAGHTGDKLADLLAMEGIFCLSFKGPGETRQSLAVTDTTTKEQFRFVMPGPEWSQPQVESLLETLSQHVQHGSLVILSGSLPPGMPDGFLAKLCDTVHRHGADLVADLSGDPLARLVTDKTVRAHILRMDQHEAETLNGAPLPSRAETADFAQSLIHKGAATLVIVARGADGSVLATSDTALHVAAADVPVKSKVGAGDSFVGAFTLALAQGSPLANAMQRGAAAASAAVMTEATELCRRDDVDRLTSDCKITPIYGSFDE